MKKLVYLIFAAFALAAFTACGNGAAPAQTDAPAAVESPLPDASASPEASPAGEENADGEEEIPELTPFALSAEEQALFDAYDKDMDVSIFKDVPPISVAKVFIQCGIVDNISAEYKLYAPASCEDTEEEYIQKTTVDATPLPISDRQRFANALFGMLDQGEFVESSPTEGYISFGTFDEQDGKFNMMKDENGVWRVNYNVLG